MGAAEDTINFQAGKQHAYQHVQRAVERALARIKEANIPDAKLVSGILVEEFAFAGDE